MRRIELLKKFGIIALSVMVMSGTVAGPSIAVLADDNGSTGGGASVAAEEEPEPENVPDDGGDSSDDGGSSGDDGSDSSGDDGGDSSGDDGGDSGDDGSDSGDDSGDSGDDGSDSSDTGSSSDSGDNEGSGTGAGNQDAGQDTTGGEDGSDTGSTSSTGGSTTGTTQSLNGNTAAPDGNTSSTGGSTSAGTGNTGSEIASTSETAATAATTAITAEEILEEPEGIKEAENYNGTNEELIAQQHIVTDLPEIRKDFRFTTVDKVYAFSTEAIDILEERSDDAKVVGTIAANGVLYELEDEEEDWLYVESGSVRGFVHGEDLIRGEEAQDLYDLLEERAERISALLPQGISKEAYFFTAQETVPYYENEAYAFRRITTQDTVIDKKAVLAKIDAGVMEERALNARTVGKLSEGDLAYVIEEAGEGWLYVESGDVRGFVLAEDLDRSGEAQNLIDENGESSLGTAKEIIKPEENKATYYTVTSIKEGAKYNEVREKILEKALSCVGNPYVWGGTSLTHGADCSGFVQTLYSLFGYHLPRVAAAQAGVGTQIPVSDAAPGDLIFFARNGYVYHVAMYAGDGKTVEAYSTNYGIITKELSDRNAVWATRIIED